MLMRNRAKVSPSTDEVGTLNVIKFRPTTTDLPVAIRSPLSLKSPSRLKSIHASSFAAFEAVTNTLLAAALLVCRRRSTAKKTPSSSAPSAVASDDGCPFVSPSQRLPSFGPVAEIKCRAPFGKVVP